MTPWFPGRTSFEAALAFVNAEQPALFADLNVHLCEPAAWPADAPPGSCALFMPPRFLAVRAGNASVAHFVASLAHEALHAVQWAQAGRPEEWHARAADEADAEEFGQAMAAAYGRTARI